MLSAQKTPNNVISRYYLQKDKPVEFNTIGYCDATEKAYSTVLHLRVTYKSGQISSQIITVKTSFPRESTNHTQIRVNE